MADLFLSHSYLLLCFPLAFALAVGVGGAWFGRRTAAAGAVIAASCAFAWALGLGLGFFEKSAALQAGGHGARLVAAEVGWLPFTAQLSASMGVLLDPLSVMMVVVVTGVALLVNIYSIGYLGDDPGFVRFFGLLAFFVFAMLGLVVSTNLLQMFVFWELVGVSSYSLIGFWYQKPSAVAASKKAFIVTRLADAFFLLGIIVVGVNVGSFDFEVLNRPETASLLSGSLPFLGGVSLATVTTLLIYTGGWGKSAMFPFHVWLPDAMEGPTPVSSIIHSATMVVAGVYLTARMLPLFGSADATLELVRTVGAFTALFAAVIAITQFDIKRILAYSTLSQIGYMMFALGAARISPEVGIQGMNSLGLSSAMFHVFTHAFFKCLLFLGAGVVIHAVHSNDIAAMGGLRRDLPVTYATGLLACLAISGVFPLSGFWSKDEILLAAWQSGHLLTFATGLAVSMLTALYMFRLFFRVFHGPARHGRGRATREDLFMAAPMVVLALPTVFSGLAARGYFAGPVASMLVHGQEHLAHPPWLPYAASLAGLAGIGLAWFLYGRGDGTTPAAVATRLGPLYRWALNRFYIDELYLFFTHRVILEGVAGPVKWFDRKVVDGAVDLCGRLIALGGGLVRKAHSGSLQWYLGAGVAGLTLVLALVREGLR